jgi:hypothetical protein
MNDIGNFLKYLRNFSENSLLDMKQRWEKNPAYWVGIADGPEFPNYCLQTIKGELSSFISMISSPYQCVTEPSIHLRTVLPTVSLYKDS